MRSNTASPLVMSLGKSVAQISAELAPVPGLFPMVEVLCGIIQLCENVTQNRHAARQLRDRCHYLVLAFRDPGENVVTGKLAEARNAVVDCLLDIQTRMTMWTGISKFQGFIKQRDIESDIERCHTTITDCVTKYQLASQYEIHEWQKEFSINAKYDHAELVDYLSQIKASQELAEATQASQTDMMRKMMGLMQTMMGENKQAAEKVHVGLSSNLYDLQRQSGDLLPDFHLKSGEVRKIGEYAVRGTATMDIYEGLYLEREKVTIKAIRAMSADERSLRRFEREVKIWADVWKRDRGVHILPFYGYCQTEGPFPYMVSPWQRNGDIVTYVKKNDDDINYLSLIRAIAEGIEILHTMEPAIVHGDIRGANILISDIGTPLISDFGLSQIIHDVAGIPFTQSSGVAESYRYFAPEICLGGSIISKSSDIYAFAMTILEIMTHQQPYSKIKHHPEAVLRASQGKQPPRPTDPAVIARGLNDDIWQMLTSCWSLTTSERPTIQQILPMLK